MNKYTPRKLNIFLLLKLPTAFISGVRVKSISSETAIATVKHRWINQNPFKSLYWAVQGMASELVTGILVMKEIEESGENISMLITNQSGNFSKKAKGRITFVCHDGKKIKEIIKKTIRTGEGQNLTMIAKGFNEVKECVSSFEYEWSIKIKDNK